MSVTLNSSSLVPSEEIRLRNLILEVENLILSKNIPIHPTDEQSFASFSKLESPRRQSILEKLTLIHRLYNILTFKHESEEVSVEEEREFALLAAQTFGLHLPPVFLKKIKKGLIIEIYDAKGIQLYRNFEFFRQCSYSLLDLLSHEWFELYERSQQITDLILKRTSEVLQATQAPTPYGVPLHTVRERYLTANRVFNLDMQYLCPLTKFGESSPSAFIHLIECQTISQTDLDHSKLKFI